MVTLGTRCPGSCLLQLLQLLPLKLLEGSLALTSLGLSDPGGVAILTGKLQIGASSTRVPSGASHLRLMAVVAGRSESALWIESRVIARGSGVCDRSFCRRHARAIGFGSDDCTSGWIAGKRWFTFYAVLVGFPGAHTTNIDPQLNVPDLTAYPNPGIFGTADQWPGAEIAGISVLFP
jgi:hypothetical protein